MAKSIGLYRRNGASLGVPPASAIRGPRAARRSFPWIWMVYLLDGKWESGKAPDLMSRGIADFQHWQGQSAFENSFQHLLDGLRVAR